MDNIGWFEDLGKSDIGVAGGKGANLGEMIRLGVPVPPGFVVTAQAYERFLKEAGIADKINEILSDVDVNNSEALNEAAEQVRNLIKEAEMPDDIREDLVKSYKELSERTGNAQELVAIRSSATAEDLPDASFAGQQETYLNIKGDEDVVRNVQKCWSSLFTPRAIFYREQHGFEHEKVLISIIVQKMVNAEKAGVLFTSHPSTGDRDKQVIEANWGLGETVVSGSTTPDVFVVDKDSGEILDVTVGTKEAMHVRDPETGETIEEPTPSDMREEQTLDAEEAEKLAEFGRKVEDHYGRPQDIEWAEEDGEIYLVQTRAVTVLYEEEEGAEVEAPSEVLVRGLGASPGTASGKVKIIPSADEIDRVEEGDTLTTEMTAPDWVPAMRRAAAIVTDEGGRTCFTGDTKVLTDKGILTIEEVSQLIDSGVRVLSVNDETLALEWKRVLASTSRTSEVWEVAASQTGRSKHNTLKVTPDHGMLIFEDRDLIEKELQDVVTESDAITAIDHIPSPPIMHNGGTSRSRDLAYLSGAIASDGQIGLSARRGSVTFRQKNTPEKSRFIDTVRGIFEREFGTELVDKGEDVSLGVIRGEDVVGKANRYVSTRKEPASRLLEIKDNIQEFVLKSSGEVVASYLAGIIDGDGSYHDGHESGRIHIYADREMMETVVLACLRLGILPQVYKNRSIYNIQIVEGLESLLELTQRVKGEVREKVLGTKLFSAKQLLEDIVDEVNAGGKIKPYVGKNLLIGAEKLRDCVLPLAEGELKKKLENIINSGLRMRRIKKIRELGEKKVYNLEVEDNHNYTVFTKHLTPILVHNCHAAIVSRELGTPCVVGTGEATQTLEEDMDVTVDGTDGAVYRGITKAERPEEEVPAAPAAAPVMPTATEVKVNISLPEIAEKVARETRADGVGLLRAEHMLLGIGKHPWRLIEEGGEERMIQEFSDGIRKVARAFSPDSIWYRTLDLKTAEFRNMEGGEDEPIEPNPMIGWRGVRRFVDPERPREQEILKLELQAIKRLVDEGFSNLGVMIPMAQHPEELRRFKQVVREVGLEPGEDIQVGIMVEIPAAALIIDQFIEEGMDFVSFGTNDLTQFTLAIDRDNERIAQLFDERHPAVQTLISQVIEQCNEAGVESSICGQAGSYPDVVEKLVEYGITSISANPDAVQKVREMVYRTERRMLLSNARTLRSEG